MMRTTVNMLVDLMQERGSVRISQTIDGKRRVPGVTAGPYVSNDTATGGWLHVVEARESVSFVEQWSDALMIRVIAENEEDLRIKFETEILFRTALSAPEVVAMLRSFIFKIDSLAAKAAELLSRREGFDELLQFSGPLLGNFVSVSDSAFHLIGSTRDIEQDDPVTMYLLEHGHHDPSTVKAFMELGLPSKWRDSSEALEITLDSPICIYPTVSHVFKFRRNYFVHMVMLCNNKQPTPGMLDLFLLLSELLAPFVERDWLARKGFSQPHDRLVGELLNGVPISDEELTERTDILHMPLRAEWQLVCVRLRQQDSVGVENAAWRLVACLGGARVTVYRGVVILLFCGVGQTVRVAYESEIRKALAEEGPIDVGLSPMFTSIRGLRDAFRQAEVAMLYGGLQKASLGGGEAPAQAKSQELVFNSWREGFVNYLLYARRKDMDFIDLCLRVHPLGRMCMDDLECATNQTTVVLTYLACNCKATPTAEVLHMHRNNVLYHLGQIKQKYGIDLDDADTRFEITLLSHYIDISDRKLRCIIPLLEGEDIANGC